MARVAAALGVADAAAGLGALNRELGLTMSLGALGLRAEDVESSRRPRGGVGVCQPAPGDGRRRAGAAPERPLVHTADSRRQRGVRIPAPGGCRGTNTAAATDRLPHGGERLVAVQPSLVGQPCLSVSGGPACSPRQHPATGVPQRGCGRVETSRYRQGRVHYSCGHHHQLTSVCWQSLAGSEREVASSTNALVQRGRWCCERQTCEEAENRIARFIRRHRRTLAEAGVARDTDSSRRCASSARARLRRWRSASGPMPHTTAASEGLRPSTPTSNRTSRNAAGSVASAASIPPLELIAGRLLKRRGHEASRPQPYRVELSATPPWLATGNSSRERCVRRRRATAQDAYRRRGDRHV